MAETKGDTDKSHQVKPASAIQQVYWSGAAASPGGKIGLEVYTLYIGNNSNITISISDKSGKKFDTIKSKMSGNKYWTEITVPEKAKEELYAEVKLTKHGLQQKSNSLYLFPPVFINNLKWDKKKVARADILKLSAEVKGLADGNEAEVQIWEYDPDNAHELVTKIPVIIKNGKVETEWEFQYPGNTMNIPGKDESENGYINPQYFFRINIGGISKESEKIKFMDYSELTVQDEYGNPISNEEVIVVTADGKKQNLKTDSEGKLKIDDVPPGKIKLEFPKINEKKN